MADLIATYGYAAVLIGTLLEGETIVVLAGFAAHRGYISLPWVIAAATAGTIASDQLFFHLGRARGAAWLERRDGWRARADRAVALVSRNETVVILGFRFLYGLRTVTPAVLGLSGVRPVKFLVLNVLGAAIWATAFSFVGYLAGTAAELVLGDIRRAEVVIFVLIVVAGIGRWLLLLRRRGRRDRAG